MLNKSWALALALALAAAPVSLSLAAGGAGGAAVQCGAEQPEALWRRLGHGQRRSGRGRKWPVRPLLRLGLGGWEQSTVPGVGNPPTSQMGSTGSTMGSAGSSAMGTAGTGGKSSAKTNLSATVAPEPRRALVPGASDVAGANMP